MHNEDDTTQETTPNGTESSVSGEQAHDGENTLGDDENGSESDTERQETFPASYVRELREENAKHRKSATRADSLATNLVHAYAESTGRLHDASDVVVSDALFVDGMPDREKVAEAVEELIKAKPHLAKIRPTGDVGQGSSGSDSPNATALFGQALREAAQ